jgi:hypothetical protein
LGTTRDEFATYVGNNVDHIVDYGEHFRFGKRISTGFVESAVNQSVDKRFDKRQSMRLDASPRAPDAADPNACAQR